MNQNNLNELLLEYSEVLVDKIFDYDNEIFKELPIVKTIHSFISFGNSIQERLFIKKLVTFLNCISDIPESTKIVMIKKVNEDFSYQQNVGEKILEILSRIDSEIKPKFVGNLFKSFLEGKIDYQKFLELCYIVEKSFSQDLKLIKYSDEEGDFTSAECKKIISQDLLLGGHFYDLTNRDENKPMFGFISEIGMELVKFGI